MQRLLTKQLPVKDFKSLRVLDQFTIAVQKPAMLSKAPTTHPLAKTPSLANNPAHPHPFPANLLTQLAAPASNHPSPTPPNLKLLLLPLTKTID